MTLWLLLKMAEAPESNLIYLRSILNTFNSYRRYSLPRFFPKPIHNPNNLTALPFKIPGITSGLKPATSKSFIQRSGVISG